MLKFSLSILVEFVRFWRRSSLRIDWLSSGDGIGRFNGSNISSLRANSS